jgi:hypothetical protein
MVTLYIWLLLNVLTRLRVAHYTMDMALNLCNGYVFELMIDVMVMAWIVC